MPFEFTILDAIAQLRNPLLDWLLPLISSFADHGQGWIVLSVLLLCTKRYRRAGLAMGLALIFCLLIGNVTLKPLVARPRPYTFVPELVLLVPPLSDYSFPSGHTYASFAAATTLLVCHRRAGLVALAVAIIIAFSRLYLYVHFPSDVVAGMVLGIASGWVACRLTDRL